MKQKRDGLEIRVWMLRNGITGAQMARDLGCSMRLVFGTIDGDKNSRKVLRHLVMLGCPKDLLELPDDMNEAA